VKYYIDTNICVFFLKGMYPLIREKLLSCNPECIVIPALVKAELLYGACRSAKRDFNLEKITQFLLPFTIEPFDDAATAVYADLRAKLERQGEPVGPNDMIIAATVLTKKGTLVTNNIKEFSRIEGLSLENWAGMPGKD
jgi:tRNA(fMet)-specific endonuclease VapC